MKLNRSSSLLHSWASVFSILVLVSLCLTSLATNPASSSTPGRFEFHTLRFEESEEWIVPRNVYEISITAVGGSGESPGITWPREPGQQIIEETGGLGAKIDGVIAVNAGESMNFLVGKLGGEANGGFPWGISGASSWNWGGAGGSETLVTLDGQDLVVAGGGGGGVLGSDVSLYFNYGGNAGLIAEQGLPVIRNSKSGAGGAAGTLLSPGIGGLKSGQSSSYCAKFSDGFAGVGRDGGKGGRAGEYTIWQTQSLSGGGGGGGGYFGGGGGGGSCGAQDDRAPGIGGGGGAGSSWASPALISSDITTAQSRGNGYVEISYFQEMLNPNSPEVQIAAHEHNSIDISWNEPEFYGHQIIEYKIYYKESSSLAWILVDNISASSRQYTVSNLKNGTLYDFYLTAVNDEGEGLPSVTQSEYPSSKCQIESISLIRNNNNSVSVKINPVSNGSALTDVSAKWKTSTTSFQTLALDSAYESLIQTNPLGTQISVNANCTNRDGKGLTTENSIVLTAVPLAPDIVKSSQNENQFSISWATPQTFGSPIKKYIVRFRTLNSDWTVKELAASTELFDVATEKNESYVAQVAAVTDIGIGDWSVAIKVESDVYLELYSSKQARYFTGETILPVAIAPISLRPEYISRDNWNLERKTKEGWKTIRQIRLVVEGVECSSDSQLFIDLASLNLAAAKYRISNPNWRNAKSDEFKIPKTVSGGEKKSSLKLSKKVTDYRERYTKSYLTLWRESKYGKVPFESGLKFKTFQLGDKLPLYKTKTWNWTTNKKYLDLIEDYGISCHVSSMENSFKYYIGDFLPNRTSILNKTVQLTIKVGNYKVKGQYLLKVPPKPVVIKFKKLRVTAPIVNGKIAKVNFVSIGTTGKFYAVNGLYSLQYRKDRKGSWELRDQVIGNGKGAFKLESLKTGAYRIIGPNGKVLFTANWNFKSN